MNRAATAFASAAGSLLAAACGMLAAQENTPARITNPTEASRAELARVVSEALNGAPVTLADDALTRSSVLTIERNYPRDARGRRLGGRELEKPEHFRLVQEGKRCVLVHERTGKRWPLASSTCTAE